MGLACVAFLSSDTLSRAQEVRFDDAAICRRCRIVVERATSLAVPGYDALFDQRVRVVRLADGRFVAGPTRNGSTLVVFDSLGRHLRTMGRTGSGPGEFRSIGAMVPRPDGGLSVFDMTLRRETRFRRNLSLEATNPVSIEVIDARSLGGDTLVVATRRSSAHGNEWPIVVLNRWRREVGGFASLHPLDVEQAGPPTRRRLGTVRGASIWTSHLTSYVIEEWSTRGQLVRRITRKSQWFPPEQQSPAPPLPTVVLVGTWTDSSGIVWSVSSVPDKNAPPPLVKSGREMGMPDPDALNGQHDTVVEAIDPDRGVLATIRLPQAVFLKGDWPGIVTIRRTESREALEIWRVRLVQSPTR